MLNDFHDLVLLLWNWVCMCSCRELNNIIIIIFSGLHQYSSWSPLWTDQLLHIRAAAGLTRSTERSWRIEAAAEVLLDFTQLNMQTQHEHQSTAGFDRQNLLDIQLRAAPWKQDAQWRSRRPVYRAQRMLADFPSLATPEGDKRSESQYGVCR